MKMLLLCLFALSPLAAQFCQEDDKAPAYSTDCKKCKDKTKPK